MAPYTYSQQPSTRVQRSYVIEIFALVYNSIVGVHVSACREQILHILSSAGVQQERSHLAYITAMDQESSWLPHSSDVIACTYWKPAGETTLKAFSSTLDLAIGHSCALAGDPRQLHIPELFCHSHAFGNAGDRICCIAARPNADFGDIDLAVSTASHAIEQVPGTKSDLEGEVQFWTIGRAWQLTCRWVLGHAGGRCDGIEWCPSIDAFSGGTDGSKRQQAGLGLLLLIANQSALIFSVPTKPKDVVESCSDQCAFSRRWQRLL